MREITIDGKQVRVRATPLALFYYKQEFKKDAVAELMEMGGKGTVGFDSTIIMQLIWAMAKADNYPKQFPGYISWWAEYGSIDFADKDFINAVMEEATAGFFCGGKAGIKP